MQLGDILLVLEKSRMSPNCLPMEGAVITVFGGTGYLGRRIGESLANRELAVRVAVRNPTGFSDRRAEGLVEYVKADVRDPSAVERAVQGASAVVNVVGLYLEIGEDTFESVHVVGARNVAAAAANSGAGRLVHISGIGANVQSESAYVRARGKGEVAVREAFPMSSVVRPSALFGQADALLRTFDRIVRASPLIPLFGDGSSRLQPVYVGDVAAAVSTLAVEPAASFELFELGGPHIYAYRELYRRIEAHRGRRRTYIPIPFAVWMAMARTLSILPRPPLTVDQLALVREDNIVHKGVSTFSDLGIAPRSLDELLPECLP